MVLYQQFDNKEIKLSNDKKGLYSYVWANFCSPIIPLLNKIAIVPITSIELSHNMKTGYGGQILLKL